MTTLFVDGDWSVIRLVTKNVYAHHNPCDNSLISAVMSFDSINTCYRCDIPIPKGIQGLVVLHNWGST